MGVQVVNFGDEDVARMKEIEKAVVSAMVPFMANTSPLLGLYVLIRCARVMLRKMPGTVRTQLFPVIFAFLEGRTEQPAEDAAHRLLWVPGRES